jgi:cytochrome P450
MLSQIVQFNRFRKDPLEYLQNTAQKGIEHSTIDFLGTRIHLVLSADAAHRILVSRVRDYGRCAMVFDRIRPLTGLEGLVQLQGVEWKEARSFFARMMSQESILQFSERVENRTRRLIECLHASVNGPIEVNALVEDFVMRNAFDLICENVPRDIDQIARDFLELNQLCGRRMMSPFTLPSRRIKILKDRLSQRLKVAEADSKLKNAAKSAAFNLDQIRTFLFAGHETTTSAIISALYLLGKHPEIQRQYDEIDLVGRKTLVAGVLNEALRLYPPAWILARTATKFDSEMGIKPGDHVIIAVREIHRNPKYWSFAEDFIPQRIEYANLRSGQYIPFGAGPKICIGKGAALAEGTAFLRHLMDHFTIQIASELQHEANITLYPSNSLKIIFSHKTKTHERMAVN